MANRIKGITVEIGGDTTKLTDSLKNVNRTINSTQSQLKDVEKLLKLDPTNTELLAQKQSLLTNAVSATSEKLDALHSAALPFHIQERYTTHFRQYPTSIRASRHTHSYRTEESHSSSSTLSNVRSSTQSSPSMIISGSWRSFPILPMTLTKLSTTPPMVRTIP